MNKNFAFLVIISTLTACLATGFITNSYASSDGVHPDKHMGTMALANLTKEQQLQLISIGMDKSEVVSKLGKPELETPQRPDGLSFAFYSHSFEVTDETLF